MKYLAITLLLPLCYAAFQQYNGPGSLSLRSTGVDEPTKITDVPGTVRAIKRHNLSNAPSPVQKRHNPSNVPSPVEKRHSLSMEKRHNPSNVPSPAQKRHNPSNVPTPIEKRHNPSAIPAVHRRHNPSNIPQKRHNPSAIPANGAVLEKKHKRQVPASPKPSVISVGALPAAPAAGRDMTWEEAIAGIIGITQGNRPAGAPTH
jgi:hypothetical protein